jgi:hypothetical protein
LAVWRGSTSASRKYTQQKKKTNSSSSSNNIISLQQTPRGQLVQLSNEYPNLIDAKFVNFVTPYQNNYQDDNNNTTTTTNYRMPFEQQMSYLAIIDIDGNNWSGRFAKLLCTNSVIIKIIPEYIEYFYIDLVPNIHYISATISNLTRAVTYVLDSANTNEMQNVVLEANKWCARSMTHDSLVHDMINQIDQYEIEYNRYIMKITNTSSSELLETTATVIPTTDFVDCSVIIGERDAYFPLLQLALLSIMGCCWIYYYLMSKRVQNVVELPDEAWKTTQISATSSSSSSKGDDNHDEEEMHQLRKGGKHV